MGKTAGGFLLQPTQLLTLMDPRDLPLYESELNATYQLEVLAELTGLSSETILHYQEEGLIRPAGSSCEFDEDTLRILRRIQHVQSHYQPDLETLKLIISLMDETERLRHTLQQRK